MDNVMGLSLVENILSHCHDEGLARAVLSFDRVWIFVAPELGMGHVSGRPFRRNL